MECILLQKKIGGAEMAEFNGQIVTNEGRNLLSRALAGQGKVIFTKAAFGDQKHSGNLREVTELKNKKIDLAVMNIRNDNGTAVLTVQISNENVEKSFRTEEFGVYAKIENDSNEILYSYTTAVEADFFPSNKLGTTYESIHEIYMAISSDAQAEIHVREGVIFLTRDIANQVYTENGVPAVGSLKGRSNLEKNKAYSDDLGHWYKNVGGSRSWNKSSTPDEDLIPMTWEYLFSLCKKIKDGLSKLKLTWESIENKPKEFPPQSHYHDDRYEKSFSKNTAFNKNFGIEEGTILEGKRLAESMGVTKYGGLIKEYGRKYQDYAYYDDNTKEMFYCTEDNNLTNASASYFKPFSNKAILNRLENLIKIYIGETGKYINTGSYTFKFPKTFKQVKGVFLNIIKHRTANDLENVYLQSFTDTSFTFIKDCVDNQNATEIKIQYIVFFIA